MFSIYRWLPLVCKEALDGIEGLKTLLSMHKGIFDRVLDVEWVLKSEENELVEDDIVTPKPKDYGVQIFALLVHQLIENEETTFQMLISKTVEKTWFPSELPYDKSIAFFLQIIDTNQDVFGHAYPYVYIRPHKPNSLVSCCRLIVEISKAFKTGPETIGSLYEKLPEFCKTKLKTVEELIRFCQKNELTKHTLGPVLELLPSDVQDKEQESDNDSQEDIQEEIQHHHPS